jgi:DNA-binding protein YbaB
MLRTCGRGFNAAVRKAEETTQEKMGKLTAGLPPGMKLPF